VPPATRRARPRRRPPPRPRPRPAAPRPPSPAAAPAARLAMPGKPARPLPPCSNTTLDAYKGRAYHTVRAVLLHASGQVTAPPACVAARLQARSEAPTPPPPISPQAAGVPSVRRASRPCQNGSDHRRPACDDRRQRGAARPAARPGRQAHPYATGRACPAGAAGGRARRARPRQRRQSVPQEAPDPGLGRDCIRCRQSAPLSLKSLDVEAYACRRAPWGRWFIPASIETLSCAMPITAIP